jgi:hypothetical protein
MSWRFPRVSIARMMGLVAALAIVLALVNALRGTRIIETLNSPVKVTGWTPSGLSLADGRTLPLPGMKSLPAKSEALDAATRSGVEVGRDGRVYGLVRIGHFCGNDPVREHVTRVDLGFMLEYLHEGESLGLPVFEGVTVPRALGSNGFSMGYWGWSYLGDFRAWSSLTAALRRKRP